MFRITKSGALIFSSVRLKLCACSSTLTTEAKEIKKARRVKKLRELCMKTNHLDVELGERIPEDCFVKHNHLRYLYLMNPDTAQRIASIILPYIKAKPYSSLIEGLPGMGFLTKKLLEGGVSFINLFEPIQGFNEIYKTLNANFPERIRLFQTDIMRLSVLEYLDKLDNGCRIQQVFKELSEKSNPSSNHTILIGPSSNRTFLIHTTKCLAQQKYFFSSGTLEMFLLIRAFDYLRFAGEKVHKSFAFYSILLNSFFEHTVLDELPREHFLPYSYKKKDPTNDLLLVHLVQKKTPLTSEQLLPYHFFINLCFRRKGLLIPTVEKWFPGCGERIICPKLDHDDYKQDIGVFTDLSDLTPSQIIGVFREIHDYASSTNNLFMEIMEREMVMTETVDPDSIDYNKTKTEALEINMNAH